MYVLVPNRIEAQTGAPSVNESGAPALFPESTFGATFRKYFPPETVFSPFYSWDADMSLDLTIVRRGPDALQFSTMFQTAGTTNLGSKVSVAGTGYFLGLGYARRQSVGFDWSAGLIHFSSHLTRDLDDKIDEERRRGDAIPLVDDASEFNVLYVRGTWTLPRLWFSPQLDVAIQPINFRFNGGDADYVRPIYLATRWTLWSGAVRSLTARTQQEIGRKPFIIVSVVFAAYTGRQPDRRFEIFISASPGGQVHSSPQIGAFRDGIAGGLRLSFRS
jgi:hypothetical protein